MIGGIRLYLNFLEFHGKNNNSPNCWGKRPKRKKIEYPKSKSEFRLIVHVEVICVRSVNAVCGLLLLLPPLLLLLNFVSHFEMYSFRIRLLLFKNCFCFFCKRFQLFTVLRSFRRKQSATRRHDYLWCHSNGKLFGGSKTEITDGQISESERKEATYDVILR